LRVGLIVVLFAPGRAAGGPRQGPNMRQRWRARGEAKANDPNLQKVHHREC
jgi:hypothetical protein